MSYNVQISRSIKSVALFIIAIIVLSSCSTTNRNSEERVDWKFQVNSLIMPFWMSKDALGDNGNYPAYRYPNGKPINPDSLDFSLLDPKYHQYYMANTDSLRRDFIRVKSRQTYGYCMAFHITGNPEYLLNAKKGLDFLISKNVYADSSAVTFWDRNGIATPSRLQRNAQDLAYALLAPNIYYYLTRDPEILKIILELNDFAYKDYFELSDLEEKSRLMKWVIEDFEGDSKNDKKLTAPLDHLNAYLLLLAKTAPDSLETKFKNQVKELTYSIKNNFYSSQYNMFWSNLVNRSLKNDTDFAHTIKTFWMLYVAAIYLDDKELKTFAIEGADRLLKTAYLPEKKSWASAYIDTTLTLDKGCLSWQYDELDQMASTLSFSDTTYYSKYLKNTFKYFKQYMINYEAGGTHFGRAESGEIVNIGFRTGWHLSNFHDIEHALIGYLASSNYHKEDFVLYYAFDKSFMPADNKIQPYHYSASIKNKEISTFSNMTLSNLNLVKVTFSNIK